jgi:hypothetical protein
MREIGKRVEEMVSSKPSSSLLSLPRETGTGNRAAAKMI